MIRTAAHPHRPEAQIIDTLERLSAWRRQIRTPTPSRNLPAITFQLTELSRAENHTLSARAEGYRSDCGCGIGGFGMTAGAVAGVAWYAAQGADALRLATAMSLCGLLALGALAGKAAGLAWARWRLVRLAARTEARLRSMRSLS